jgi:hypothetical protein
MCCRQNAWCCRERSSTRECRAAKLANSRCSRRAARARRADSDYVVPLAAERQGVGLTVGAADVNTLMWFADIYCDLAWVSERNGVLGPKRVGLRGAESDALGIAIEFHFFGDERNVRHVRALMHTDDQRSAETCLNLNVQSWVAALEVTVMIETQGPFQVAHLPGSQLFAVVLGQGAEDTPAAILDAISPEPSGLRYERIAFGMATWCRDVSHHLFYFRRLVDGSLPLDVRWLNGYRLLEWHFVGDRAGLAKSQEWRAFVARFNDILAPCLRPNQTPIGVLEEARALAAHAGMDDRSDAERARDPRNPMEKTFRVLEQMVMTALNEHPARVGSRVRFEATEHNS